MSTLTSRTLSKTKRRGLFIHGQTRAPTNLKPADPNSSTAPAYPWLRSASAHVRKSVGGSNSNALDKGFDECNEDETVGLVPGLFVYPHPIPEKNAAHPSSSIRAPHEGYACSLDHLAVSERDDYFRFSQESEVEVEEPVGLISRSSTV